MAGLADLLEAYKNYRGVQDWKLGQQMNRVPGAEEAMDLWGGWDTGGLAGAIKTYHGTPNPTPFTKFRQEFMGTGAGQQFGRGHYFAENPKVAQGYAEWKGQMFPNMMNIQGASEDTLEFLNSFLKYYPEAKSSDLLKLAKYEAEKELKFAETPEASKKYQRFLNELEGELTSERKPQRSLYEVSLEWPGARESSDPMSREHFYQWDKTFKNQPQHIRQALEEITQENPNVADDYIQFLERNQSKGHTLSSLLHQRPELLIKEAGLEPYMQEKGIPGIVYKNRRPMSDKSYNYVVFGDEIPRIISHNKPSVLDMLWPKK